MKLYPQAWFGKEKETSPYELLTLFSVENYRNTGNSPFFLSENHGFTVAPQKILRCFRLSDFEKNTAS
jgi:hypothetical protein